MSTFDEVLFQHSVAPAVRTATATGTAVSRVVNGGMQDGVLVVYSGPITDGSFAVTLEDSADGSTGWAAVPAAQLHGSLPTLTAADDNTVFEVGVRTTRDFLRAVVTVSGATDGGLVGAAVVLGSPRFAPVARGVA